MRQIDELPESLVGQLWEFWQRNEPRFRVVSILAIESHTDSNPVEAADLTLQLVERFSKRKKGAAEVPSRNREDEVEEISKAVLSKLRLRDFGIPHSLGSGSSSHSGSRTPIIYQDRGVEALDSPLRDDQFPEPAGDNVTEILWPRIEWDAALNDTGKKSEAKLKSLIEYHTEEVLKVANCVFMKPKKELCHPKTADFVLVEKELREPTPETVGAILFAQSTTESTKSYTTSAAVGEVGQILLRNAAANRHFVMVGVTNVNKIKWFKVERPGMNGEFNGCRGSEFASVRNSLAGFMCSPLETLGISKKSIMVGQEEYRLGRWLGEGATSDVYAVKVQNQEYAVKVAKKGYSISMDVSNLERLKNIKGIPKVVMSDTQQSNMVITPVAAQFSMSLLIKRGMTTHLGQLVDTLKCAHDEGLVNRDIRIANLLIAEDQLIIVDWEYAAPLNVFVNYAGTTHFASANVLKSLEQGSSFPVTGSDDLVSLVRTLYADSRRDNLRLQESLICLCNDEFAKIQEFWEAEMCNTTWQIAERRAEEGDYDQLKLWLENWARIM